MPMPTLDELRRGRLGRQLDPAAPVPHRDDHQSATRVNGHAVRPAADGADDGVDWGGRGGGVRSPLPMIEPPEVVIADPFEP